jgi:hypothetical protein
LESRATSFGAAFSRKKTATAKGRGDLSVLITD